MTPTDLLGVPSWPFGRPDRQSPVYAATIAATITNGMTIIDPAILTGNATLNLTINSDLRDGAILQLKVKATSNSQNVTLGTGFLGAAIVGVAGKTQAQAFVLIDGVFIPMGAPTQID